MHSFSRYVGNEQLRHNHISFQLVYSSLYNPNGQYLQDSINGLVIWGLPSQELFNTCQHFFSDFITEMIILYFILKHAQFFSNLRSWSLGWIYSFWQAIVQCTLFLFLSGGISDSKKRGTYYLYIVIMIDIPLNCNSF